MDNKQTENWIKNKERVCASKYPMVVIKLVLKDPSEKRKRRQLLPTPAKADHIKNRNLHKHKFTQIITIVANPILEIYCNSHLSFPGSGKISQKKD